MMKNDNACEYCLGTGCEDCPKVDFKNRFLAALKTFVEGAQKIVDKYHDEFGWSEEMKADQHEDLIVKAGTRYIKIIAKRKHSEHVYAFIDATNGDVLKPASYKAPAKHARGNILDEWNGLKYLNHYGPAYLRG